MYSRNGFRAEDFSRSYPGYMLFNNSSRGIDFTDTGLIRHLEKVYTGWKSTGIKGIMFDYPGSGWSPDGDFEDSHSTTAAAYSNMFKVAFENIGPDSYIQENKLSRGSDITLGVVASQRTAGDTVESNPQFISTNRHIMQGYLDMIDITWNEKKKELHGVLKVTAGEKCKIVVSCNGRVITGIKTDKGKASSETTGRNNGLATLSIESPQGVNIKWIALFR